MPTDRLSQLADQLKLLQEQLAGVEEAKVLARLEDKVLLEQRIRKLKQEIQLVEQEYRQLVARSANQPSIPEELDTGNCLGKYFLQSGLGTNLFVGRSQDLIDLHQMLQQADPLAITAATGMGGIGKTTLAWHYAAQYRDHYPAGIWWMSANQVVVKVVEYAEFMGLPLPPDEWNETRKVQWFYQKWAEAIPDGARLIVWDDVFDAEAYRSLQDYLPPDPKFRLLITTRTKLSHPIQRLELGVLGKAAAFRLLRKLVGADDRIAAEVETAKALCDWVGRLPLGIELIGRYLEIHASLRLETLLSRLEAQKLKARALQQVPSEMPYRDSIEAAFELSWQTLSEAAKQVGSLLSLFALAPIPKELIANCWDGDEEDLEDCLDLELVNRSLLSISNHGSYLLHALTREFFAAKLENLTIEADELRRRFAEVMTEVAKTIPYTVTLEVIARVKAVIPHVEAVTAYTYLISDENCVWPHTGVAWFYQGQSLWQEAEHWYKAGRKMTIDRFGANHPSTAQSLNNLAELYRFQGQYTEAERLLLQALQIKRSQLGQDHPDTALSLNNLAVLYRFQGRYAEAEPLHLQALQIRRSQLGQDHPDTAQSLNNLAELYRFQGRYAEAEPLHLQALQIKRSQLSQDHPDTAQSLRNLAELYRFQGRYAEAEPLYQQALQIHQSQLGQDHPDTATSLNSLAALYEAQGRYAEAEPLHLKALQIYRLHLGQNHIYTATSLNNLAALYEAQGRYAEAEPLHLKALQIYRLHLGQDHPDTATSLNNLAQLYNSQGRYAEAEPLYLEALQIHQSELGPDHPDTALSLNNLATLYCSQGRYSEAEPFYLQALDIRRSQLGSDHPNTAQNLHSLAVLYYTQGRYAEAEPFYQQALQIRRSQLGPDHPDTARNLNNLAVLYRVQGRYIEAEPLHLQALQIRRLQLSPDHPDTIHSLNNLAALYYSIQRFDEAELLAVQALEVQQRCLGDDHPSTIASRKWLDIIRSAKEQG